MSSNQKETRNLISGYPTGVSYRYVAETFGDKLREQKLREKQLFVSLLDTEFFKIKHKSREILVNVQTPIHRGVCELCNPNANNRVNNYFVNVLETQQLSLLRWAEKQFFIYPRLMFVRSKACNDCSSSIINNEELREILDQFLLGCEVNGLKYKSQSVTRELLQKWVKRTVKNLTYSFSLTVFKLVALGWYLLSTNFASKFIVSPVEISCVKEACKTDLPIVYVVQNETKFDWFKILFLLVFCKLKPPVIFLQYEERPWLRWIYRKCGVIFLNEPTGEKTLKNSVRDEMFIICVDENLKMRNHLMFYFHSSVESDVRYLLDLIVDEVRRTSVPDVTIVPVSMCYEKVENTDTREPFKFSVSNLLRRREKRGFVKVTFSQPYSLMAMIQRVGDKDEIKTYDPTVMRYDEVNRTLVPKIYDHIAHDFSKIRALTSTNIVSYLLLKKFQNGVALRDLVDEVDKFRLLLKSLEKSVAFTGASDKMINHTVNMCNYYSSSIYNDMNDSAISSTTT